MGSLFRYRGHEILIDSVSKAEGIYIYDSTGKRYADLESGVWCLPLGHRSPAVETALRKQMDICTHTGYCYTHPVAEEAAEALLKSSGMEGGKCMLLLSGSESVEAGVRAVRQITGKKYILTFKDSFLGSHGSAYEKSPDEWYLLDWKDCEGNCEDVKKCKAFRDIPFSEIGGFVFEPGSSSGFVRFPPQKLVDAVYSELKKNGGIYMVNEVTTGIGRTGKMYGYMHYGHQPDIVAVGKGVGNGYPVSAVMSSAETAELADKAGFGMSQSHQNDPAGAAAVTAVLSEIEGLLDEAAAKGEAFITRLRELMEKHECISEVRGRGLMVSVTLQGLDDETLSGIHRQLFDGGYIVVRRPGTGVLRLDPPLITPCNVLEDFCCLLDSIVSGL